MNTQNHIQGVFSGDASCAIRRRRLAVACAAAASLLLPVFWVPAAVRADSGPDASATTQPADASAVPDSTNDVVTGGLTANGTLTLMAGHSQILKLSASYKAIDIPQPDVIGFHRIGDSPDEILINALKAGRTQLIVWDTRGRHAVDRSSSSRRT